MPTDKPRVMLTLDPETHDLMREVSDATGISIAGIISKLLGAHLHELAEYSEWIKKVPKGTRDFMHAKNLLWSYGPDTLVDGIRALDPKHKFIGDLMDETVKKLRSKKKKQ